MNTPTLNVNLKPCDCAFTERAKALADTAAQGAYGLGLRTATHSTSCSASPIAIPCPIPRSVTFEVRLGECDCLSSLKSIGTHTDDCRSRPVRVSCSISGKTWAESEPGDVEGPSGAPVDLITVCRERWALVKALLAGIRAASYFTERSPLFTKWESLFAQRDAVFSALADKARAEQADDATAREVIKLVPRLKARDVSVCTADDYISARALAAYVEHLIEQVSVL